MNRVNKVTITGLLLMGGVVAQAANLQSVMDKALQSNPEIQASFNNLQVRQQQVEQAKGGYYPRIDLRAAVGRESSENISTGFTEETLTRQELKLELRQNLFEGFATESEVARQKAFVRSAESVLADNKNVIALRVAQAYINVIRNREIVTLAEAFVKNHQSIYSKIEKRSASGVGLKSERVHAAGRLAQARSNLTNARANLDESNTQYLVVVGEMPSSEMLLPEKNMLSKSLDTAIASAKKNNPTVAIANANMEAAMQGRKISNSDFYPELDVVLSSSRNEDLDGVQGSDDDQLIMLQLKYNLFNGGSDSARKQQSSYEVSRSKFVRDNAYRLVEQKVRSAWFELESRNSQLLDLKQHLDSSVKTRDVYSNQYRIGKRTLLDLLDTENELFNARINYANAVHVRVSAQHKLLAYMGELVR